MGAGPYRRSPERTTDRTRLGCLEPDVAAQKGRLVIAE